MSDEEKAAMESMETVYAALLPLSATWRVRIALAALELCGHRVPETAWVMHDAATSIQEDE